MDGMRILVVEDERLLADAVAEWLRREAFAVDVAYDGDAALERLGVNGYDVVVLDRDLPVVHGDEVCRAIVDAGLPTRVLMLTASDVGPGACRGPVAGRGRLPAQAVRVRRAVRARARAAAPQPAADPTGAGTRRGPARPGPP
jgi:CheY-like chemotaxis protein